METPVPVQVGFVDEETFEIVDLIHSYSISADFARWITDGRFNQTLLQDQIGSGKFTRMIQYDLDGSIFFNGRGELYTHKINKQAIKNIVDNQSPLHSKIFSSNNITKVNISRVISEPNYNVISHLLVEGELVGMSWEIYDLPLLINFYKTKLDPMRYWRNSRLH